MDLNENMVRRLVTMTANERKALREWFMLDQSGQHDDLVTLLDAMDALEANEAHKARLAEFRKGEDAALAGLRSHAAEMRAASKEGPMRLDTSKREALGGVLS